MALKNFFWKGNRVGCEVAGLKITIFVISDPTWTHILAPKMEFLNQNLSFQSLFDPKLAKISPYIIQIVFLANSGFNFYSGISIHYSVLVNVYLMQNIKKTHWNTSFSLFSHIVPNFAPQTTPNLLSLVDFQSHMLGDSININNLCCNPV